MNITLALLRFVGFILLMGAGSFAVPLSREDDIMTRAVLAGRDDAGILVRLAEDTGIVPNVRIWEEGPGFEVRNRVARILEETSNDPGTFISPFHAFHRSRNRLLEHGKLWVQMRQVQRELLQEMEPGDPRIPKLARNIAFTYVQKFDPELVHYREKVAKGGESVEDDKARLREAFNRASTARERADANRDRKRTRRRGS